VKFAEVFVIFVVYGDFLLILGEVCLGLLAYLSTKTMNFLLMGSLFVPTTSSLS
jgi:hypothetical protein